MIRRPPRVTRTDTLFPYTTLFRSVRRDVRLAAAGSVACDSAQKVHVGARRVPVDRHHRHLSQDQRISRADGGTGADKSLAGAMGALCLLLRLLLLDVPDAREAGRADDRRSGARLDRTSTRLNY